MRDRCWRRWRSDTVILKRIKSHVERTHWFLTRDTNGIPHNIPDWYILLGQQHIYLLKSQRTLSYMTFHKCKWGKQGKKNYNWSSDYHTRPKDKQRFLKELKDVEY
jgi:hypothetical protein